MAFQAQCLDVLFEERVKLFDYIELFDGFGEGAYFVIAERIRHSQFKIRSFGIGFLKVLVGNAGRYESDFFVARLYFIQFCLFRQCLEFVETLFDEDVSAVCVSGNHHIFCYISFEGGLLRYDPVAECYVFFCMRYTSSHSQNDRRIEFLAYLKGLLDVFFGLSGACGFKHGQFGVDAYPSGILLILRRMHTRVVADNNHKTRENPCIGRRHQRVQCDV